MFKFGTLKDNMEDRTVLFIGSQGSGKGTQARLLRDFIESEDPDTPVFYFGTGAHFRSFAQKPGFTSERVAQTLDDGNIQPVFLSVWLWTSYFVEHFRGNEHVILEGSPRTLTEAHVLESALRFYNRTEPLVIYLSLSEETAKKRILDRGRSDDTPEAIEKRFELFREHTVPSLEYLKNTSYYRVETVDAEPTPEEIQSNIKALVKRSV